METLNQDALAMIGPSFEESDSFTKVNSSVDTHSLIVTAITATHVTAITASIWSIIQTKDH